jgi:hypothetical protein
MQLHDPVTHESARISKRGIKMHGYADDGLAQATLLGDAYAWTNVGYASAGDDTILLVRNDDDARNLVISAVIVTAEIATLTTLHLPANPSTPAGTTVSAVNLNRGAPKTAVASAWADETANAQANVIGEMYVAATETKPFALPAGAVVLSYLGCIAVDFVTAQTTLEHVTIIGYFEDA